MECNDAIRLLIPFNIFSDLRFQNDTVSIIDTRTFDIIDQQVNNVEVNEISWNTSGDLFYLTTGQGTIKIFDYPSFKLLHTLRAHTANCYCIEIDPRGRYLAAGSADATVSLWDLESYTCLRSFTELRYVVRGKFGSRALTLLTCHWNRWPVRTISFSYDGQFLASASEDSYIDIVSNASLSYCQLNVGGN